MCYQGRHTTPICVIKGDIQLLCVNLHYPRFINVQEILESCLDLRGGILLHSGSGKVSELLTSVCLYIVLVINGSISA
jgi:hypothetical protein